MCDAFKGNIFQRMDGLDWILKRCDNKSILDIGCCYGLISYEFARNGIKEVYGIDILKKEIDFCRKLFRDVPIKSSFECMDIIEDFEDFKNKVNNKYDIVLFLGVYHHLSGNIEHILNHIKNITGEYLIVRTPKMKEFSKRINMKVVFKKASHILGDLVVFKTQK